MLFFFKIGDSYKIVKVTQYYDDLERQRPIILYDEVKITRFFLFDFQILTLQGLWSGRGDTKGFQEEHREYSPTLEKESPP